MFNFYISILKWDFLKLFRYSIISWFHFFLSFLTVDWIFNWPNNSVISQDNQTSINIDYCVLNISNVWYFFIFDKILEENYQNIFVLLQTWQGSETSTKSWRWNPGSLGVMSPGLTHGPGRCLFSLPPCQPVGAPSSVRCGSSLLPTASKGQGSSVRPGSRPVIRSWI